MSKLSFFSPIISGKTSDLSFKCVSAFDNYFSYSGRKYQVISQRSEKRYEVEETYVKPSVPMNILKVVSLLTGIVPLIMFIGKVIARSQYRFYLKKPEKVAAPADTLTIPNRVIPRVIVKTHQPANVDKMRERSERFARYKQRAVDNMQNHHVEHDVPEFHLTAQQKETLKIARANLFTQTEGERYRIVRGGTKAIIFLDSAPGFVFKYRVAFRNERESYEEYCQRSQRARDLIRAESLHLLHVPHSQVVEVDDRCFIMEQRCSLEDGSFAFQKGLHRSFLADPEMKPFMKRAYGQLAKFIGRFNFGDVKYDNIAISEDGRIELFDLDTNGCIAGYTSGHAGEADGLFNYLPLEWIEEFKTVVENYMSRAANIQLNQKIESIIAKAEQNQGVEENYQQFIERHEIKTASQEINPNIETGLNEAIQKLFAKVIIEELNAGLHRDQAYLPQGGRIVYLQINTLDNLTVKAKELFEQFQLSWIHRGTPDGDFSYVNHLLPQVLEGLKSCGAIFSYTVSPHYPNVKVRC